MASISKDEWVDPEPEQDYLLGKNIGATTMTEQSKPQMISLTDAAADHVRALMSKSETPVAGLRVSISTKGCSGLSYVFEYADEKRPFEEEVDHDGARIFIDPMATMFLIGAEMDYEEGALRSGFTFNNPNEKSRCGCGESFSV